MTTIDLSRVEQRFLVPFGEEGRLAADIAMILQFTTYSDRPFSQTVYINDDELSVPWGVSLKARRYIGQPQQRIRLHPRTLFSCEIKTEESEGSQRRLKQKKVMRLKDFCQWASTELAFVLAGAILRPHIVTQYYRRHYVSQDEDLRLTLDTEMQYGFFPANRPFIWTGNEDGGRVEIKIDQDAMASQEYQLVMDILSQHGAITVISKKEQGYNFHGHYLDINFGCRPQKELRGVEIEAKFEVCHPQPQRLFDDLKRAFLVGSFAGYMLEDYPFTQATASINHYWSRMIGNQIVDGVKFLYRAGHFGIVTKEKTIVIEDPHHLNCILRRSENKSEVYRQTKENVERILASHQGSFGDLRYCGFVYRQRHAFWPENVSNGRIYHLSLDRCICSGRILYQMELEYVGRRPGDWQVSSSAEEEIVAELSELAWVIYQYINRESQILVPSQLTKFEWLIGSK